MKIDSPLAASAGIKYYSTSSEGIGGEIKRRITDFVVEEIDEKGILHEIRGFNSEGEKIEPEPVFKAPEGSGDFLILEMEKLNLDTNNAVTMIARSVYAGRNTVGYAGMKDKRALTCQLVSVRGKDVSRLTEFNSRYISIKPLYWANKGIEIGNLSGNRFTVTIRKISIESDEEIRKRILECFSQMSGGIANYFGGQRFGGIRSVTHLIGKEFVKGNFRKGVMLYLCSPSEEEEEEVRLARKNLFESQKSFRGEGGKQPFTEKAGETVSAGQLDSTQKSTGWAVAGKGVPPSAVRNDFQRALNEFPLKYRYERAILSHLSKYPDDFVNAFHSLPKSLRYMFTHAYQSYLFNKIISKRIELGIGIKKAEGDVLDADENPTAQLFGYESRISRGTIGEIEREILGEEEVSLDGFRIKEAPEISSKGNRRAIVVKPQNPELLFVGDDEQNDGMKKATVRFSLVKGSYATIAIGEIIKNGLCL